MKVFLILDAENVERVQECMVLRLRALNERAKDLYAKGETAASQKVTDHSELYMRVAEDISRQVKRAEELTRELGR